MALKDNYTSNQSTSTGVFGATWAAQTFTAESSYNATNIKIKLFKIGTITDRGDATVGLIGTTGGTPNDDSPPADLATGTILEADLQALGTTLASSILMEATLSSSVPIVSGTVYAIVLRFPGGNSGNRINWDRDALNGYANGGRFASTNSGDTWPTSSNNDQLFEIYSEPQNYDEGILVVSGIGSCILTTETYTTFIIEPVVWPPARPTGIADEDTLHNNTLIAVGFDADGLGIIYFKET